MSGRAAPVPALLPWLVWGLGALFYGYGFFQRVAPSVMVGELMRDFAVGGAILGNLSAFYFYAYAGVQLPVGVLVDRLGSRRLLVAAGLLSVAGSALFAVADDVPPAYVGRLLIGAGAGFTWVCALKLAALWFPPGRFAFLSGLTLMTGMIGGIGGQAPLAALVEAVGWRDTLWGAAVVGGVLTAAVWGLVRDRPAAVVEARPARLLDGLRRVMRTPQTWIVALFGSMLTAPMLAFAGLWGVPYMMRVYGLDRPAAAAATSLMLVGWAVGAPLAGAVSDRIRRRRRPMVAGAAVGLAAMLALLYVPDLPLAAAHALLLVSGLAGGCMVITFAAAREHNPAWAGGACLGLVNAAVMASGAVFQPLIGLLLDAGWDGTTLDGARVYSEATYAAALATLPACLAVGLAAALLTRETHARPPAD